MDGEGASPKSEQALARHSTPDITFRRYVKSVDSELVRIAEAVGQVVAGAGFTVSTVSRIERLENTPSILTVAQLAAALDVQVCDLLKPDAGWNQTLKPLRSDVQEMIEKLLKVADRDTLSAVLIVANALNLQFKS